MSDSSRQLSADGATHFAEDLKRRGEAAQRLEKDLLADVPLLYGSPGSMEPRGDPAIVLAKIHREELVRKNGGGITQFSNEGSPDRLPFEGATAVLAIVLVLILFSGALG